MKNNLRILAFLLGISVAMPAIAQKDNVGIGTTKPDQSAVLDVSSSTKGFLMPRMSLQQRSAIQNPAQGLVIYQTDFLSGFYFYDGAEWKAMTSQNSISGTDGDWAIGGSNAGSLSNSIIGAFDQPLRFLSNGTAAGLLGGNTSASGNFNTAIGGYALGFYQTSLLSGGVPTGARNAAIGYYALRKNVSGLDNFALGLSAAYEQLGSYNVAIGNAALLGNVGSLGNYNTAIGYHAMQLVGTSASNNTAIGPEALENVTGSGSIAIGYQAGQNETSGNKLYIANSNTATPLVYGDFGTAKYLAIGEVAVADRAAAATGGYRLLVKGGMMTEKIKVAVAGSTDWADYVFEPAYQLMPLDKVESFVKENKHLPNVPSADDMVKNGLDVTKTSAKLMEKIEELTLYMIEMNKEIKALKEENSKLKK